MAVMSFTVMVAGWVGTRGEWERERVAAFIVIQYVRMRGERENGSVHHHHIDGSGRGGGGGWWWHSPLSCCCEVGDDKGEVEEGEGIIIDV
jgi:hypothetical protein